MRLTQKIRKPDPRWAEAEAAFKTQVSDKAGEIDPEDELDWYSLTVGWALARGLTPEDSIDLAIYIRYETDLG